MINLIPSDKINDFRFDGVIIICEKLEQLKKHKILSNSAIFSSFENFSKLNKNFENGVPNFILHEAFAGKRVIYTSTGPLHGDFENVSIFKKAGVAAGKLYVFFYEILKNLKKKIIFL